MLHRFSEHLKTFGGRDGIAISRLGGSVSEPTFKACLSLTPIP